MKVKFLIIINLILFSIIIFMGVHMYGENKEVSGEWKRINTVEQDYNCLQNPIDPLFAQALSNSHVMIEYCQIQQLYYETWIAQYNDIMKKFVKNVYMMKILLTITYL